MKFFCVTNIFDLQVFNNETTALLFFIFLFFYFFEICIVMRFVSLFFLNERNITISLLMVHLKCTVIHYANLNSSSINKPFLSYRPSNMLFRVFCFLIYVSYLAFGKLSFLIQIFKIHFKMYYVTEY